MSLSSKTELARALFRTPPSESVVRTSGTATADSADGTVTVQLEDGDVIEVGTIGSVSAGDTVTIHVQRGEAQVIASEGWGDAMQQAVDEAQAIAEATGQHFWSDDNGAHVTQVTQEEWETTPTGPNALWNSLGLLLRNALTNLASFTTGNVSFYDGAGNTADNITASFGNSGVQVGKAGESHLEMDYHSLKLIDKNGQTYFQVSDLRGSGGTAPIEESFTGDGFTTEFTLTYQAVDTSYTVKVNGVIANPTKDTSTFTFASAPADGASIVAEYETSDPLYAYTLGVRRSGTVGNYSISEGVANVASGKASHAEGSVNTASGKNSHAEGSSNTASEECSHAEGTVNTASGPNSHAEGAVNTASGRNSHAEGSHCSASGQESHAEGFYSEASGTNSHAQNYRTIAQGNHQTAIGKYNVADSTSALIIGNGTGNSSRSNALTVDWSGNVEAAGGLTLGGKAVSAWVVETGTNNGWAYEKRSDGTYRATWSGNIALGSGTSWGGFYYHQQTTAINAPSFSTGFEVVSAVKNNSQLAWYVGRVASTTSLQGYWVNGNSGSATAATFGTTTYTIEGTY